MDVILSILGFVLGLSAIVIIHEFGHYFFAKKAGVLCYEFSLGMGPAIYKKKVGETLYAIRAIPLGGYVSMAGEEINTALIKSGDRIGVNLVDDVVTEIVLGKEVTSQFIGEVIDFDLYAEQGGDLYINMNIDDAPRLFKVKEDASYCFENGDVMQIAPYNRCFESKSLWARFLSIAAGPVMNFVLALIIYLIVGFAVGRPSLESTEIATVSGQAESILLPGDKIMAVNGEDITSWGDDENSSNSLRGELSRNFGVESIVFKIDRGGEVIEKSISPDVYIMNIGVLGTTDSVTPDGVKIQVCNANGCMNNSKEAGLKNDDVITTVDGIRVHTWQDLISVCNEITINRDVEITIKRTENGITTTEVKNVSAWSKNFLESQGTAAIIIQVGISPKTQFDFIWSLGYCGESVASDFVMIGDTLAQLFTSSEVGVSDLSGPVGIFNIIDKQIKGGMINFLAFLGFLSINVGIVNLLPIPALDGGRLVFLGYELVARRKVNRKVENIIHMTMFVLLMALFAYVTFNDIGRLFG